MGTIKKSVSAGFSLFGKTREALLALLYGHPEESFYLRQIVRAVATGQGAVQRELASLTGAGIIARFERDKQVYYCANKACPFFPELHSLMIKTGGMAGVLTKALQSLKGSIAVAFVFGSQAEGTATTASDIDLMVVGNTNEMALHRALMKAEARLGRVVNYTLMNEGEFQKRRREKGGFVSRVLAGPKVSVIGNVDEI
jgi:predicted nucleotidyltransferase